MNTGAKRSGEKNGSGNLLEKMMWRRTKITRKMKRRRRNKKERRRRKEKEKVPVFPLTCAWSVLSDHTMPAQDIKFVVLNAL